MKYSNHREKTLNLNLFECSSNLNSLGSLQCQWIHHWEEGDEPHRMLMVEEHHRALTLPRWDLLLQKGVPEFIAKRRIHP